MKRLILALFAACSAFTALADTDTITSESSVSITQSLPVWMPEGEAQIRFEILRKGKPFGQHYVDFKPDGNGGFTATNDIDLIAKIGPITAYRYRHDSVETWKDGRLIGLEGTTRKEGKDLEARARLDGGKLRVEGTNFTGTYEADLMPANHWNISQLISQGMLSTEGGQLIENKVENLGRETLTIAGQEIEATKFKLISDLTIFLWYDDQGRWVRLDFEARGQKIEYILETLY